MTEKYLDFHIHTTRSDGVRSPSEICKLALNNGLSYISITDHNHTEDLSELRQQYPQLTIVQGAEISAIYTDDNHEETEVHIVALGFDPECEEILDILRRNQPDRVPYINAILDKLRIYGIDLGDYDTLCEQLADKHCRYVGRMQIARLLYEKGYTESVDDGFDTYIGGHGKRLCYVKPPLRYVSMEEAVNAIIASNGLAVLCHLYYYQKDDQASERLVQRFSELTGNRGALEVNYARYTNAQRSALATLADRYGLMYSSASDYHGQAESETLDNRFPCDECKPLLAALGL